MRQNHLYMHRKEVQMVFDFLNSHARQDHYNKFISLKDRDTSRIFFNVHLMNKWLKNKKLAFDKEIYFEHFEPLDFRKTYQTFFLKSLPLQLTDLHMTAGGVFKEDLRFTYGLQTFGPYHPRSMFKRFGVKRKVNRIFYIYVSKAAYHWFVDHIAHERINLKQPFYETPTSRIESAKYWTLDKKREQLRRSVRIRSLQRFFRLCFYYIRIAPYTRNSFDEFNVHHILKKKFFLLRLRALKKTLTSSKRKKKKKSRG